MRSVFLQNITYGIVCISLNTHLTASKRFCNATHKHGVTNESARASRGCRSSLGKFFSVDVKTSKQSCQP